jgi:hypothetical protein
MIAEVVDGEKMVHVTGTTKLGGRVSNNFRWLIEGPRMLSGVWCGSLQGWGNLKRLRARESCHFR